LGFFLPFI